MSKLWGGARSSDASVSPMAVAANEVVLVDEIDMLSGDKFYGQTHNQVALFVSPAVEDLLREVWRHQQQAADVNEVLRCVKNSPAFKAVLQQLSAIADIVNVETEQMCADLADHVANKKDYIFKDGKVGYKVMDGVAFDVVKGYKTAFAYLEEASKQALVEEAAVLSNILAMRIPCGRFSYANVGCAKILGVSGTLEALSNYEWDVMRRFGIRNYTLVPSLYGKNNFAFLNQVGTPPITISQTWFYDITAQARIQPSLFWLLDTLMAHFGFFGASI